MRGGDGMEVIIATEATKVKKMDDNGRERICDEGPRRAVRLRAHKRVKEQVRKQGLKQSLQKMKWSEPLYCVCVCVWRFRKVPLAGTINVDVQYGDVTIRITRTLWFTWYLQREWKWPCIHILPSKDPGVHLILIYVYSLFGAKKKSIWCSGATKSSVTASWMYSAILSMQ